MRDFFLTQVIEKDGFDNPARIAADSQVSYVRPFYPIKHGFGHLVMFNGPVGLAAEPILVVLFFHLRRDSFFLGKNFYSPFQLPIELIRQRNSSG